MPVASSKLVEVARARLSRRTLEAGIHAMHAVFSRILLGLGFLLAWNVARAASPSDDAGQLFFENRIRPVLVENCYECHSAKAKKLKGGLRVDSREALLTGGDSGPAIVPGDPAKSLLLRAVRHDDEDLAMPHKKPKLPDAIIADLAAWVRQGAQFPTNGALPAVKKHWAFQPVKSSAPPAVKSAWPHNSVDAFIFAKLQEHGAQPAAAADKRTLLRRATYDLTGLPPTAEEADAFENDSSTNAFAKVVERLLASPRYGEHWGRHWLDVVRYADTAGETADYPVPVAWRYRNYVIDAFNADKPYDEFLREQIAGDILARRGPREHYAERVTATGFLAISRRFGFDSENYHHLTIQDTIDTLGQSVLGLSLGCARCHAHKFDPVSLEDYYALYGIFDSTRYAFPGSEQKQKYRALVPLLPAEEAQSKWSEFEARVAFLARKLERQKQSVPTAVLRSLDELDGNFEMQAPAAGGSKGVLVPPWVYEGPIAVTTEAQSPFKNLHPLGKVGASVPAGTNDYRIAQALYPSRTRERGGVLYVNLDFRVATNDATALGRHRFWIGAHTASPALEILLSADTISLRAGDFVQSIRSLKPNQWHNLQLALDLKNRSVSGSVGAPGDVVAFRDQPFSPQWSGTVDFVALDSQRRSANALPGIAIDNLGVQETPIPPVSTDLPSIASLANEPDSAALTRQLKELDDELKSKPDNATALITEAEREARRTKAEELRRQLAELAAESEKSKQELNALLAEGPMDLAYAVSEGTPRNARIQLRGEPDKPGEEVPRGFLKILGGDALPNNTVGSGRLELAQWLTRPENPLTARVMVNRIWQFHFGQGLVKTPNDFGARGQPPTHPELLDYLATQFIESGWSIKAVHRLIMLSATYQQASATGIRSQKSGVSEGKREQDVSPDSRLLTPDSISPFPRRRLTAEEIRDSILLISGELDTTPGRGHPFPKPTGWGYTQHNPFSAVYDHNQRSVYLMTQRIKRHPFLTLFDGTDPNASNAERRTTTVPTQALFFLNDPFVHTKSEKFAARVERIGADAAQRIQAAYRLALGRSPTETERAEAEKFLAAYRSELEAAKQGQIETTALAALARVLFASNEFLSVD